MYKIGTVLHGNNPKIGNLWIITKGNSFEASLLFDGKTKMVCASEHYRTDNMSPGMRRVDLLDIPAICGYQRIPSWARNLGWVAIRNTLAPAATTAINAALGTNTSGSQMNTLRENGLLKGRSPMESSHTCPARKNEPCSYKNYYGFTDVYQYCLHCDHKKGMPK